MKAPCRCDGDLPGDRPTREDLLALIAQLLVEIDACRMMMDLPPWECRRSFTCQELEAASQIGLVVKYEDGTLTCWPES
jgi:hypothetical protein